MFKKKKNTRYDRIGDNAEETGEEDKTENTQSSNSKEIDETTEDKPLNAELDSGVSQSETKEEGNGEKEQSVNTVKAEKNEEEIQGAPDPNTIMLNVKGTDDQTHKVQISKEASVTDLKNKIASVTEFGVERQRLIYLGKMLDDALKLCDYNIKDGNFIHLVPKPVGIQNRTQNTDMTEISLTDRAGALSDNISFFHDVGTSFPRQDGIYDRTYIQSLTLGLWRARIRLMCSLMLFYYFLQFMTNLSFWLHPDQANFQFEEGHHPTNLFFAVDAAENTYGMLVAWLGLKTAADDSTILSRRFLYSMYRLCVLHFINLAIYAQQLLSGQIKLKTIHKYDSQSNELGISVLFNVMINIMIWITCISIASRYNFELASLEEDENAQENGDGSENAQTPSNNRRDAPSIVVEQ